MDEKVLKFFKKYNIHINDIKYLLRQNNKTCIYTTDERVIKTFITVKDLFKELRPYNYICINKGTVVAKEQIKYIENCTITCWTAPVWKVVNVVPPAINS